MISNRSERSQTLYPLLLISFAASIPVSLNLSSYITALLVLNWLMEGNSRIRLSNLLQNKLAIATIFVFFIFVLGLAHTSNIKEGFKQIEHKLSLLILPLIIFSSQPLKSSTLKNTLLSFTISSILVATVALLLAILNYLGSNDISELFYHQLSKNVGIHAIYLSCYLVFSFFIILFLSFSSSAKLDSKYRILLAVLEAYVIALLLLLASKTLLIVLLALLTFYIILYFSRNKKKYTGLWLAVSVNIIMGTTIFITPYTKSRFENALHSNLEVLQHKSFRYDTEFSGLSLRLLLWKFAFLVNEQEKAHLYGVGTGDSQDEIVKVYKAHNLYMGNPADPNDAGYSKYNTHNQFVETYLKLGLLGALYFLAYLVILIIKSIRTRQLLFFTWLVIFIAFSLTESTLQVNKGIIYFSFFIPLFLQYKADPASTHHL